MLQFPNGHLPFEAFQRFSAGVEGGTAVGGGDGDGHTGLADGNLSQTMDDVDPQSGRGILQFGDDGLELLSRHGSVGVVGDAFDRAIAVPISNCTDKQDQRSAGWVPSSSQKILSVDGSINEGGLGCRCPSRNRRQQRHF